MGSAQTGLNKTEVDGAIGEAERCGAAVVETIKNGFIKMIKSLDENWGTQDGKNWVEGACQTEMNSVIEKAAQNLSKVGQVISAVANAQYQDTQNTQRARSAKDIEKKVVKETIDDHLSNNYVGVYTELQDDLKAKEQELITELDTKLGELQSKVIAKVDVAFNKVGAAGKVSSECTIYINRVKNIVRNGVSKLNGEISTNVAKADEFVKSIQDAGLRGANDGNGGN